MGRREDGRRIALLGGGYEVPDIRVGQTVADPRFAGLQEVLRLHDCPLGVWPVLRRKGTPVWLGGSLLRAVREESNAAVAHWWGVHPDLVTRWRKFLSVPETNDGTRSLRRDRTPTHIHSDTAKHKSAAARWSSSHRQLRRAAALRQAHGEGGPPGEVDPGKLLEALRAAGLTQSGLARASGVSPMRVSQLVRGIQPSVTRATLLAIADALAVESSTLLSIQ